MSAREHHAERAQAVVVGKIERITRENIVVVELGDELQKWLDQVLADKLPGSTFRVAFALGRGGPTTLTDLADSLGCSRRTVQRCIARLAGRGHLGRGTNGG